MKRTTTAIACSAAALALGLSGCGASFEDPGRRTPPRRSSWLCAPMTLGSRGCGRCGGAGPRRLRRRGVCRARARHGGRHYGDAASG
ncbi:MAG: hypothetical protein ACLUW6_06855 [Coriobacteriaceae bacterium]